MATQIFCRIFPKSVILASFSSRSISMITSSASLSHVTRSPLSSLSFLHRLRPIAAISVDFRRLLPAVSSRTLATRATSSSLNDPNPNWSNRPPKETILLDGCDFEHWLVVMEKPEGDPTRDEIIDSYIKTLAQVVGSEEEARMKIYSVSTRHYYAFGALVSEELSYKIKELPRVRWVLPDSYLDVKNKDYGGEPFINGQAVPYDPKYHEEWVRNNARANERNRRNDRPRNADRSRNFDRRRENIINRDMPNQQSSSNMGGSPRNFPPNMSGTPPSNTGGFPPSHIGGGPPNNMSRAPPNGGYGNIPPNTQGGSGVPPSNYTGMTYNNMGGMPPPNQNIGGMQPPIQNLGGVQPPNQNMGGMQPPNQNMGRMPPSNQNAGGMPPNAGWSNNVPGRDH